MGALRPVCFFANNEQHFINKLQRQSETNIWY